MKHVTRCVLCVLLLLIILFNVAACNTSDKAVDLMDGIVANAQGEVGKVNAEDAKAASIFAVNLFKASNESGNTLISPLSVFAALSMAVNGADGKTRQEMEAVLGMETSKLNEFFYNYVKALPVGTNYKLSLADSVWIKQDINFTVNAEFLQANADYYGAGAYKAPFNKTTLKEINNWVKKNTDGMIPKLLNNISSDTIMYLINALAFDAEWDRIYKSNDIASDTFTTESGEKQSTKLMFAEEDLYLEDSAATGFIKYYADRKYAFVALLPKQGVSVKDYVANLDGASLYELLSAPQRRSVSTWTPKFKTEYSVEMTDILQNMGMKEAFSPENANFSRLGNYAGANIYISQVIHKTTISVDGKGTKAGAATAVVFGKNAAAPVEKKIVKLNRPFVYMLIDTNTRLPFFIGSLMNVA